MQLTEDGRVFHVRARDLLAEVDDLHSMFAGDRVALRGRLRVDLPTEVARTTIVPALPAFMATYPELELELSSTDRQVDLVQEGFDCVLRLGPIRDETLIARPLGKLRMVNVGSPRLSGALWRPSFARRSPASGPSDSSFFDDAGRKAPWMGIRTAIATRRFNCQVRLHVNSAQTYEAAALAGLGLIQAPFLGVGRYLESGVLVENPTRFSSPALAVSLVVAHRSNLSRRVRAFMKWIEDVLTPYLE